MGTFDIDEKYALSIYHFNLQYKAGDKNSYFHLHRSSMKPFLRFFDRHPNWAVSLELQGHYLKFMERYFPDDLALFRKLNQRDQLELVSVHYSDQIYLAYPLRDLQESININKEIFEDLGLTRSGVWFGQENFFGPGIAERVMEPNGYHTALLNHHYVWHHTHQEAPKAPYWKFKNLDPDHVNYLNSSGQGYEDESIRLQQNFCYWGDAELAFGATPYAAFLAKPQEQYLKNLLKYGNMEKNGTKIVRVEDYIKRVQELGLTPKEGPYFTDGTWNMDYYQGVYLWMGYYRLPWERDAKLRSLTYRTRSRLLVVEKLVQWAETKNIQDYSKCQLNLKMAWKHLLLSEVSDSTGQQPFPIEIAYTRAECHACNEYLDKIVLNIKSQLQLPKFVLDTGIGDQAPFVDEPCVHAEVAEIVPYQQIASFFPSPVHLMRPSPNKTHFSIHRVNDEFGIDDKHFLLNLDMRPLHYTPFFKRVFAFFRDNRKHPNFARMYDERMGNYCGIAFPLWEDKVIYSPACMEDAIDSHPLSDFAFDRTWLPLPNGLIGLGNDTYVIKHNCYGETHIACTLNFQTTPHRAEFFVLNAPSQSRFRWQFSLFRGSEEDALHIANNLNVFPTQKI